MNDKDPKVQESQDETKAKDKEAPDGKGEKNPLGENVKPAMYIMFDTKKSTFFIIGAPGFLDEPYRAYGALKIAEKNLDDYYLNKKKFKDSFMAGVRDFSNKMRFRNFINGR